MTDHVLVDNVTHKNLRINKTFATGHGFDANVATVFPVEFSQLQAEYPLLFIRNPEMSQFMTIALLGFSDGENLYLTADGWDAGYLPLTVERQPFLIGFQERTEDGVPVQAPVVHIDLEHPSVSHTEGEPVFLEHGGESPLLERVTSVLMTIHQGHDASRSFSELLAGLELIESLALNVEFDDGSKVSLDGLYTINEDKLKHLNAGALETLHRDGHLQNVYMMLASLPNLANLIARKNKQISNSAGVG